MADVLVRLYHPELPDQPIDVSPAAWEEHYQHTQWQKTPPKNAKAKAQEPAVAEPTPIEPKPERS